MQLGGSSIEHLHTEQSSLHLSDDSVGAGVSLQKHDGGNDFVHKHILQSGLQLLDDGDGGGEHCG